MPGQKPPYRPPTVQKQSSKAPAKRSNQAPSTHVRQQQRQARPSVEFWDMATRQSVQRSAFLWAAGSLGFTAVAVYQVVLQSAWITALIILFAAGCMGYLSFHLFKKIREFDELAGH